MTQTSGATTINGGEAVVHALVRSGVDLALGIVGSSIIEVFNLLPKAGIRYIGTRHEQVATLMADGYARVSRRPAVVLTQNGGGVTNSVTGAANALKAHSPMVIIAGTPSTSELDKDTFQEVDQLGVMRPVTKWAARVPRADRLHEYVMRAVHLAATPPMGPTYVEIARDLLYESCELDIGRERDHALYAACAPDPDGVAAALELVAKASAPVLLAGSGVVWAQAQQELCQLAAATHMPIVSSYYHGDVVPSDDPWYLGALGRQGAKSAIAAMAQADAVLAIGTKLDPFSFLPHYGLTYGPETKHVAHVDIDGSRLGSNYEVDVAVVSDARQFVRASLANVSQFSFQSTWDLSAVAGLRASWREERQALIDAAVERDGTLPNLAVWQELAGMLPEDAVYVTDIGGTPSYAYNMLDRIAHFQLVTPGYLGSLGFASSAAMGASLAGDREVVAFLGDGSLTMMANSLITAVEYGTDVLLIVFDNGCWGAEWRNQEQFNNAEFVGSELDNPDLARLGAACGWRTATATTLEEVRAAVQAALVRDGTPRMVVIKVDKFSLPGAARTDVLKVAQRGRYR